MSIPLSQLNLLSTYLLVTVRLFSTSATRLLSWRQRLPYFDSPCEDRCSPVIPLPSLAPLHHAGPLPSYTHLLSLNLCLDCHSLKVSQGSAQCHPHSDHPHHPLNVPLLAPSALLPSTIFYRPHITIKRDLGSYLGEGFVLFQSPLLEQKLQEGRTSPALSTGGHSQCLRSYLAESQMPSEVRQVTAMNAEE